MGGRNQLIQVLCSTAMGRVMGFADVLAIGGPVGVKTRAGEPVIGQREHVTTRNGGKEGMALLPSAHPRKCRPIQ